MKNKKVTITDIAEAMGLSPVSISRALSDQTGISDELKRKVIQKAAEMGYVKPKRNMSARILVLHQTPYREDNSNFSHMMQGIEKALQKEDADYSIEFLDKETQNRMILPYRLSKGFAFDGVILIGRFNLNYAALINEKIPNLIFLTGYSPAYDYDSVWFSFINAGYKQCQYLIDRGHTRIGFVGNRKVYRNKEKQNGIAFALEENGLPVDEALFWESDEDYPAKLQNLIADNRLPTAFICDHDFTAIEFIRALHQHDIKVPDDVSILGSGNTEVSALSLPPLTTMDLNIEYSCRVVVSTLLKRIAEPDKPAENIAVLSTLVERESVRRI
ncbi:LacI family DNA-binding transcriptional regulator [Paenibacillus sp. URB8-2]|uniref:LacI family DNA-binding transcriptional regulator n=1 Tax=Paenibacillus sp. URB8-2 TaxID=2741301 RepID=UPI0015B8A6E7|nr:LacI family DNA-binding transcriptional regulator [Paenibacillus sp. URB8-2]BCG60345.1 LacI family transcriptional regulator [Paenibacillus sp. URB8-2]